MTGPEQKFATLGTALIDRLFFSIHESFNEERAAAIVFGGTNVSFESVEHLSPKRFEGVAPEELKLLCETLSTGEHELRHVYQATNTVLGFHSATTQRQLAVLAWTQLSELRKQGLTQCGMPLLHPRAEAHIRP